MKKTLVIGASLKPHRYSNMAIHALERHGHEVKAFGLKEGIVSRTSIDNELQDYRNIHTVTLYMNAKRQEAYYDYIISLNPKRVIFNPGAENFEFKSLLDKRGIANEMACTLVLLSTNQY